MVSWPITTCVGAVFVALHVRFDYLCETMKNLDIDPNVFTCFFDVSSLFTNVILDETIKICSEALCDKSDSPAVIPNDVCIEWIKSATSLIDLNFNNFMCKKTDGIAMGSPLGPALTKIFVGCYEENLFSVTQKP